MALLNISKEAFDSVREYTGPDFPVAPAGPAIPFELDGSKVGTFEAKDGDHEYLILHCITEAETDDGEIKEIKHGEFFDLDDDRGKGKLKAFMNRLGMGDHLDENLDTDILNGMRFTADIEHYDKKKGGKGASMVYDTIVVEGGPDDEEETEEVEETEETEKPKKASKKKTEETEEVVEPAKAAPAKPRRRGGNRR